MVLPDHSNKVNSKMNIHKQLNYQHWAN